MDVCLVNEEISKFIVENCKEVLFWTDESGCIMNCNAATVSLFGYQKHDFVGKPISQLDSTFDDPFRLELIDSLDSLESVTVQSRPKNRDGSFRTMEFTISRLTIDQRPFLCFLGHQIVLEEHLRYSILEALATGEPLAQILELVVELSEKTRNGMLGSILLLDESGILRHGASTQLPKSYCQAVDGIKPGPDVGSCGTAAFRREPVMVHDVLESPLWTAYRDLAKEAGLRACWSVPIFSMEKEVLGTLAMYFRAPQIPSSHDLELMNSFAFMAGIAIERAREHERLFKSELRNRSLVQSTSATVWTTSPRGEFDTPQESWQAYTGQTWDEHQGFGWSKMIHPEDRDRILKNWMFAIEDSKIFESKGRLWHAESGAYRYFEVHSTPIIVDGRIIEWVGYTIDVHDRKLAKDSFVRNQAILAQAQEVAHLGSWVWDIESDVVQWSEEFCRMHNLEETGLEANFESLMKTVFVDDRARIRDTIQLSIKNEVALSLEYRILPSSDQLKSVFSKMKFETNSRGKITGLIGTVLDVTDLRRTEMALLQSERQLRTITDSLPVLIAYIDTDYRFKFINARFETLYEKPREEIQDRHVRELMGEDAFADAKHFFDEALQGIVTTFEQRIELRGGRSHIAEVRLVPDKNLDDIVDGVYALVDDITERRALEKEILNIAANEHRRIGQDLHDGTGQELTGLGMIADTLVLTLSRKNAPEQTIAEKLARGIKRALRQVKSVARGLNPVDISSAGLMSALTEMAEHVGDLYGIQCRLKYESSAQLKDNQVATQLFRIAQEATTNAAKHSQASEVEIYLCCTEREITLSICDDGIGIQLTQGNRPGMGLRIMKYRTDLIGGRFQIVPGSRGGTQVICSLPARISMLDKEPYSRPRIQEFSSTPEELSAN